MSKNIGLHLSLKNGLVSLVNQALDFKLAHFQFFLTHANRYVPITTGDISYFTSFRHHFGALYIHSSYWINPATGIQKSIAISRKLMLKEITYAHRLEIPYLVVHAGTAKGFGTTIQAPIRMHGIDAVARFTNSILKTKPDVTILFENTAHAGNAIGSNLEDFYLLKAKIDYPEKIGFCLDTAHAFSYGYDLTNINSFIASLDKNIGLSSLSLIHLNDSYEDIGCNHDRHALPGTGKIGLGTLTSLAIDQRLAHIPKIIEFPELTHTMARSLANLDQWNERSFQNASPKNPLPQVY